MHTTIHVRMRVAGEPFRLPGFLDDVKSRHGSNPFSFNRIIRMPIPVPDDDLRNWRRRHWGAPHDAFNVAVMAVPGGLAIEFDCREAFPGPVIEKLVSRYENLDFSGIYENDQDFIQTGFSSSRVTRFAQCAGHAMQQPARLVFDRAAA